MIENDTLTVAKAIERLNNKLNLLAAAAGIAAAAAPETVLPFIYAHRVAVCIYLVVGVAPIQEFFHPRATWQQMKTNSLAIVWSAKFAALWLLVLWSGCQLLHHETKKPPETAQVVTDYEKLACESGASDPACKNYPSVIQVAGGETLKYVPPASLPKGPAGAGFVPILYLGHKQEFALYCGTSGEQGTSPIIKDSTVTCP